MTQDVEVPAPNQVEIKILSQSFLKVCAVYFNQKGSEKKIKKTEMARQMLTSMSALLLAVEVIKDVAKDEGLTLACQIHDINKSFGGRPLASPIDEGPRPEPEKKTESGPEKKTEPGPEQKTEPGPEPSPAGRSPIEDIKSENCVRCGKTVELGAVFCSITCRRLNIKEKL